MLSNLISRAIRFTLPGFIALGLQAILPTSASAAPFTNGSFESPGGPNEVSLDSNPTYVTGWTATGSGMFYEGPGNSHGWTAHTGSYGVSFGHNGTFGGTLSQTFDTVPGLRYTITYYISRIGGGTSTQAMAVEAFDAASNTSLAQFGVFIPAANNVWTQGPTLTFTATSASTRLVFTDNTGFVTGQGADSNWALDSVRVAEAPPIALTTLHAFSESPNQPQAPLLRASDGSFYGTTRAGGAHNTSGPGGTVFKLTPNGTGFDTTVIHSFSGADGNQPLAAVIQGSDGSLYGTASEGGANGVGTVFRLAPNGNGGFIFTTLHHFSTSNSHPRARLLQTSDGSLYGTTIQGGTNQAGTVFRLTPDGNGGFTFATLHSFNPSTTGANPQAGLVQGSDGNLYGTTLDGGPRDQFGNGGWGTVYKLAPDGTGFTVLHSFAIGEGRILKTELMQAADGDFYGVAYAGGPDDAGTIFRITPTGTTTVLYRFTQAERAKGLYPHGPLVQGPDGAFYGVAESGGADSSSGQTFGTVFKMTVSGSTGTVTPLHQFTRSRTDGAVPVAGVVLGGDGFLYGTTAGGGVGRGTAYRVSVTGTDFTLLTRFTADGGKTPSDLMQARDGNFYGATIDGGAEERGTLFRMTPAGVKTIVHTFSGPDGENPRGALVQGRDGSFYGTTEYGGGPDEAGTLFRLTPSADGSTFTFTLLYVFNYTEGGYSAATLIEDRDTAGVFYGVGQYGGTSSRGNGIVFKATVTGDTAAITVLHNFDGADGAYPSGKLVQAADGTLFGTTGYGDGGRNTHGTIFKLGRDGTGFTVLHQFTGTDGGYIYGGLWAASDGSFYGTTGQSTSGGGTVFRLLPNGDGSYRLKTLHTFGLIDGNQPLGELVQGSDGDLYGVTFGGGPAPSYRTGTIFKIVRADDSYVQLYAFTGGLDGIAPGRVLVPASDGNLYGVTEQGGAGGAGTVFRLVIQPLITSSQTAGNQVGGSFSYRITAVRGATSYSATGLPLGLTLNSSTGEISGKAQCSGTYTVQLSATNAAGSDTETLTVTIAPPPAPVLTAPAEGARTSGTPLLTGTSDPGNVIVLTITGGGSPVTVTTTADSNGNFSVTSPELSEGTHSVSAVVRFCNDTESSAVSNTRNFAVDKTPPVITASDVFVYNQNADGANVQFTVSANDAIDGPVNATTDRTSGSFFPIGTTTVTVTATDAAGNTATRTFTVTVRKTEMANISTRVPVGAGDNNAGIGGFIIRGDGARRVVIRAIGPSMNINGEPVPGRLQNPTLELFDNSGGPAIASNDDWQSSQAADITGSGLAPNDPRESAILIDLPAGDYTAVLRGAGGETGNALVEVYALVAGANADLGNISTRGQVLGGDNVLIGGVIVRGADPKRLLIRAIGPKLADRGVQNALQNPTLDLRDANGELLIRNDDWRGSQAEEIQDTKMAPEDERESAIVATLSAGNYTAVVSSQDETTGIGLVEVFNLQ